MRWEAGDLTVEVLFSQRGVATQVLVRAGPSWFLLDAGDGALRDLLSRGYDPRRLCGLFLTHGHADHMAGLYGILGFLRAEGRRGELLIGYPAGCREIRQALQGFQACYGEGIPFAITELALRDGDTVRLPEGLELLAKGVLHWDSIQGEPLSPAPALGYRLSFQGRSVAITGDSAWCPALEELLRGTDLALIEASLDEDGREMERIHLTLSQARRLSQLAKAAFLIHRPDGRTLRID